MQKMDVKVCKSNLEGSVDIPGSKSHTIRGLLLGLLADGESRLHRPLDSSDTRSCIGLCKALGGGVDCNNDNEWFIYGTGGQPKAASDIVDIGNSGTSLFLGLGVAALADGLTVLTGDEQIRSRDAAPLLTALRELGATAYSRRGDGCAPLVVGGGLEGGKVVIECPTSQYLSSLLIACPLAEGDTEICVPLLHEAPYVEMTCQWLGELDVQYECSDELMQFEITGGQSYPPFVRSIPADFSSATFFLVAAAVTGSELYLRGLDMYDSQGDKAVVWMLEEMGCEVTQREEGLVISGPDRLRGREFDLNSTPDALPAMAVAGCCAEGETRLFNVAHARRKETDRISVMASELGKMGAVIEEREDGLVIQGGGLKGAEVDGYGDHRVVMALTVAGLVASGATIISTAEAVSITFPNFFELMKDVGAQIGDY
jgi:3-phosphoshikimate 1-carboxyvinyltransferase